MQCWTPVVSNRANFSSAVESSSGWKDLFRTLRGWTGKVTMAESTPRFRAAAFTCSNKKRCPLWTPSKKPIVATLSWKEPIEEPLIMSICYKSNNRVKSVPTRYRWVAMPTEAAPRQLTSKSSIKNVSSAFNCASYSISL